MTRHSSSKTIEHAVRSFRRGAFVIIVDDEARENEGDLCVAADRVTAGHIAFMSRKAGGLICTAMDGHRLDQLEIEPMVPLNTSRHGTAFSISVEARGLVTTGISAQDRAATVHRLIDPTATPADFTRPGHTFPLRAVEKGVLERAGHTEAAVDLARLAGLYPAGVICEIMNDDGSMARMSELQAFAREHGIEIVTVRDLVEYRQSNRREKASRRRFPGPGDNR